MSYCPQCLTEYIEGTNECADCGVPLEPGSPPARKATERGLEESPEARLVRIRTFSGPTARLDADLARNLLRLEGIFCILPGEASVGLYPVLDLPLLVREEDAEQAAAILKSYLDSPGPVPIE